MNTPDQTNKPLFSDKQTSWVLALLVCVFVYRLIFVLTHDYDLFVDEAQYWLWSKELAWGYYSKPPLVAWLIGVSTWLFGDEVWAIKLPALLAYPLAGWCVYLLGRRLANPHAGWLAVLVFITMPGQALGGWMMSPDGPLLMFWALSLWLLHRGLHSGWGTWLLLGLVIGLGALAKYTMLVFLIGVVWVLLLKPNRHHWRSPKPWLMFATVMACLWPNIRWNMARGGETVKHTADLAGMDRAGWHWDSLFQFVTAQWLIFGLVALPVLLYLLFRRSSPNLAVNYRFLRPFVWPYFIAMVSLSLISWANANWMVVIYIGCSLMLALWFDATQRMRLFWVGITLNVVLSLLTMHYRDVGKQMGVDFSNKKELYTRVLAFKELSHALQPVLDKHGGIAVISNDRRALATYAYYLSPRPYPVFGLGETTVPQNHYEALTQEHGLPEQGIWVDHELTIDEVRRFYRQAKPLGQLIGQRDDAPKRTVQAFYVSQPCVPYGGCFEAEQ